MAHYNTLGVRADASADDLKKAYKKLALEHHPDRGGDTEMFKRVGAAFATLSDPDKRRAYDELGAEGAQRGPPRARAGATRSGPGASFTFGPGRAGAPGGADVDPHELFRAFFGGGGLGGADGFFSPHFASAASPTGGVRPSARFASGRSQFESGSDSDAPHGANKPSAVTRELALSLEELYSGCTKRLRVTRRRAGRDETKVLEVYVKPHWKPGTKITFPNEGDDAGAGTAAGDIVFVIAEKPHARFRRRGDDLELRIAPALADVLAGKTLAAPHLDAAAPRVSARLDCLQPDADGRLALRLAGRGMPLSAAKRTELGATHGDLVIVASITLPTLTPTQREVVVAALEAKH